VDCNGYPTQNQVCIESLCANTRADHLTAVMRILKYLKGTTDSNFYVQHKTTIILLVTLFPWEYNGYVFILAGALLSWCTQTQYTTALSNMESEYYALHLRMLCEEAGIKLDRPLFMKEDHKSCISFSKDPGSHKRMNNILSIKNQT
jgi:hypothetical protein